MTREIVKYPDGVVFTRLLDSYGHLIAEARGRHTLKQMIKMYGGRI